MKKDDIKTEKEEKRQPEEPEGIEYVAAKNKPFAERFIGVFRLAKAGVKRDRSS